jgi:hypothetical protein
VKVARARGIAHREPFSASEGVCSAEVSRIGS